MSDRIRVKRSMYQIHRNSRFDGSIPWLTHRCSSLLCTKAFDFNWASRRESARTRYARGILNFRKNQVFANCGGTMRMRGRKEGGVYISRWSFGGSETGRNWNWVDVHICRRPVPAIDVEHWFYFIFGPCAANLSPSSPSPPHIDRTLDSACLALMRLFCAIQLIPLRERQADERKKGRDWYDW